MTPILARSRCCARLAQGPADLAAAQALRHLCFVQNAGLPARPGGIDTDAFDSRCLHLLVEDADGQLVATFRLLLLSGGAQIGSSYSAQFYDLGALSAFPAPLAEIGRFCIRPGVRDADVLRVAWGALTRLVDDRGVQMLFGCSSFPGTDPAPYADAFALLGAAHLAPDPWRPQFRAPRVYPFAQALAGRVADPRRAALAMPPLLRSYLAMGGWVSDHAVVDADLGTLHVFTGVEIARIPEARARALRAVAGPPLAFPAPGQ